MHMHMAYMDNLFDKIILFILLLLKSNFKSKIYCIYDKVLLTLLTVQPFISNTQNTSFFMTAIPLNLAVRY